MESFLDGESRTGQAATGGLVGGKGGVGRRNEILSFSRNVICVDVVGPGLVDLSFVDLPGEPHCSSTPAICLSCL